MPTPSRATVAVLFDLDGTLVDSIPLLIASMRHAFRGRTHAPTNEEWVSTVGRPLHSQMADWATSLADVDLLIAEYRAFQLANHDRLMQRFHGVTDTVSALAAAGHPLAIVTSKGEALTRRALSWAGIAEHFDVIIGLESTTKHKPDPAPVVLACERLGVPTAATWFVGDSPFDILAGNAAGARTCAALWGPFRREQLVPASPTSWAEQIGDIPAIVRA